MLFKDVEMYVKHRFKIFNINPDFFMLWTSKKTQILKENIFLLKLTFLWEKIKRNKMKQKSKSLFCKIQKDG